MNPLLPIVGGLVLLAGCSSHYHRVHGDTLTLYLDKPDARQVFLACSNDMFVPHEARNDNKRWAVSLPAGSSFRYFYLVDGEIYLPPCRMKEKDDFGSENCIFEPNL
jgi:hypothetical protein